MVFVLFACPILITFAYPTETIHNPQTIAAVKGGNVTIGDTAKEEVTETVKEVPTVKEVKLEVTPVVKSVYFKLTEQERLVVERIVAGEARGESLEGQMLVAQCILNACLKDDISPSEVRTKYKYSGWSNDVSSSVKEAVERVFDNGETVVDEPILYFYAPSLCVSKWHETLDFVIEVGCHRFFKEW